MKRSPGRSRIPISLALVASVALVACGDAPPDSAAAPAAVEPEPPPAVVPRLTTDQVEATLRAVFGEDVTIPPVADKDPDDGGFKSLGGATAQWSPRGVESLEAVAYAVASQALAPERRDAIVPCAPADPTASDSACAGKTLAPLGRRLWRRPLADDELAMVVGLADQGADALGDFYGGLEFGIAALIQSPRFLFRTELGDADAAADPGAPVPYGDFEMASRLAFVLLDRGPDTPLLDAAEAGSLTTDEGLEAEIARLLKTPAARQGLTRFFDEWLHLHDDEAATKDPMVFPAFEPSLPEEAAEETRRLVEALVFDWNEDIRELLTTRRTFVNRKLASIYEIPAPALEGFAETELPEWTQRAGILGHVSFLAREAHAASTSPTGRGKFVREQLLCQTVPLPPADVDTSIPEQSADAPTLRERMQVHFSNPGCAGCHQFVDPIGLGFEHFDGVGRYRDTEEGYPIDATGELDGLAFEDHRGLGQALAQDPRFTECVVEQLYRFVVGARPQAAQRPYIEDWHAQWEAAGFRFLDLVRIVLTSDIFRQRTPEPAEEGSP